MKFTNFKEIKIPRTIEALAIYLEVELRKVLRDLQLGITKLAFVDNFEAFQTTVTILAGTELAIQNELVSGAIPTQRLIVRSNSFEIVDGDTAWSNNFVYLKNTGGLDATLTVIFFR